MVIPRHPDAPPHHLLEVLLEPLLVRHQPSSDSMIEIFVKVVDRYHWAVHLKWLSIVDIVMITIVYLIGPDGWGC